MQPRTLTYATYWRNSLADAELGQGRLSTKDVGNNVQLNADALKTGRLCKAVTQSLFADAEESADSINVLLRPWLYHARLEHGQRRYSGIPEYVAPIRTIARLRPDGRLYPEAGSIIPRDLLEPTERGAFAIGTMTALDVYLTQHNVAGINRIVEEDDEAASAQFQQDWLAYLAACRKLLEVVGGGFPQQQDGFISNDHGLVQVSDPLKSPAQHIIRLYDHLREEGPEAPLFASFANDAITPPNDCLPANSSFAVRVAHPGDAFPLATAQRDALTHLLATRDGDILAVNGPPGTGKTTLVLSVVATLWARAALAGGDPPVVAAVSSNNQAVTNVIDAFGKDFATGDGPLAGRWLPDVESFGAFFPASSKAARYSGQYQTRAFFEQIETPDYVSRAETAYQTKGHEAFPTLSDPSIDDVVAALRESLRDEAKNLANIESTKTALDDAADRLKSVLGDQPAAAIEGLKAELDTLENDQQTHDTLRQQWETWRARESIFYALFAWLPPVADKRMRLARLFLKEQSWHEKKGERDWRTLDDIEASIQLRSKEAKEAVAEKKQHLTEAEQLQKAAERARRAWTQALTPLSLPAPPDEVSLADIDAATDTQIRFRIFLLTTHYWEGRWLMAMGALGNQMIEEQRKTGRVAVTQRWHRRMMVTPCAVSTFFMLPQLMAVSKYAGTRDGEKNFNTEYLYDFADLLIVDEAGQALPEVAGASFALARKALVIGDTEQLEPIGSTPPPLDIGNLTDLGLIQTDRYREAYQHLSHLGKTSANGSVMRIAQHASRFHYDPELPRGMFLYEHRRCYDEIIGYCNDLCYHGKLIPRRGAKPANQNTWPPFGYLHIDGFCESGGSRSRQNRLEAETLAAWLADQQAAFESTYPDLTLAEIVAVVTPFRGQVAAIKRACSEYGLPVEGEDAITVGTVHSLQGAERPVVLFSTVYSKHADGGFIDQRPSMLNVAVSRAKDTFLVFGDMDVLELAGQTQPRGLLARALFSRPDNALSYQHLPRPDLVSSSNPVTTLSDWQEHDAFLLHLFGTAQREIHLVTPWIILERMREIGAIEAMRNASERGVRIHIYADADKIAQRAGDAIHGQQRLQEIDDTLKAVGVDLLPVWRVHSKSVTADNAVYCNGSFNWFSARRDHYANHETSFVYRGPALAAEINALIASLRARMLPARRRSGSSPNDSNGPIPQRAAQ